jgi:hypothetical protein
MTSPTVVPLSTQVTLPIEPFVTVAEFKNHPTWLDTQLVPGSSSQSVQDDELRTILLMATESAENYCNQPIAAHIQTDYRTGYINRWGRLSFHAQHGPVRTVLSYSYGMQLGNVTSVSLPLWQPDGDHQVLIDIGGTNNTWVGSLGLGFNPPPTGTEMYTTLTYVAGYSNATLTGNALAGATTVTVTNPTGIFAGDVLRFWAPSIDESVVVASSWQGQNTYPYTPASIPLVNPTVNAHSTGDGVSGVGADVHLAVIYIAVDGIQRWGTTSSNWPGTGTRSAIGKDRKEMTPWLVKAFDLLESYRAVR